MKIKIEHIEGRQYKIIMDGNDISKNVRSIDIHMEGGRFPVVDLKLINPELDVDEIELEEE